MKRFLAIVAILAVGAAYVAGYWPEHQRRAALEAESRILENRLAEAEARVRMGELLGRLMNLVETVSQQNYGTARSLSSPFFDAVRAESGRTKNAGFRTALEGVLEMRDSVIESLTRGEPASLELLRQALDRLRRALGYLPPAAAAAAASPSPAPPSH